MLLIVIPTMKTFLSSDWGPALKRATLAVLPILVAVYTAGYLTGRIVHAANDYTTMRLRSVPQDFSLWQPTPSPTAEDQASYEAWLLQQGTDQYLPTRFYVQGGSEAWRIANLVASGATQRELEKQVPCSRSQARRLIKGQNITLQEIWSYQERYIPEEIHGIGA